MQNWCGKLNFDFWDSHSLSSDGALWYLIWFLWITQGHKELGATLSCGRPQVVAGLQQLLSPWFIRPGGIWPNLQDIEEIVLLCQGISMSVYTHDTSSYIERFLDMSVLQSFNLGITSYSFLPSYLKIQCIFNGFRATALRLFLPCPASKSLMQTSWVCSSATVTFSFLSLSSTVLLLFIHSGYCLKINLSCLPLQLFQSSPYISKGSTSSHAKYLLSPSRPILK